VTRNWLIRLDVHCALTEMCFRYWRDRHGNLWAGKSTSTIECGVLKLCIMTYLEKLIFNWGNLLEEWA